MADVAGLPTPVMDWSSTDAPQALRKFRAICELMFDGPLADKTEAIKVRYLLLWTGEEGIELASTWDLSNEDSNKLNIYWECFEQYVAQRAISELLDTNSEQLSKGMRKVLMHS